MNRYYVMVKDERHSKHYNLLADAISNTDAADKALKKVAKEHTHGKLNGLKVFDTMLYK